MNIPSDHNGVYYTDFLASIAAKREVKTYFEIGVMNGLNFSAIPAEFAVGVDPAFDFKVDPTARKRKSVFYRISSDEFFKSEVAHLPCIDMAFLDGMHVFEYLLRDIYNTEARCSQGSVIFLHDCLPYDDEMIQRQSLGGKWTGDVWKTLLILKKYRPDIRQVYIDCPPTGLVALTCLDPTNCTLKNNYYNIVQEYSTLENNLDGVAMIYKDMKIVKSEDILNNFDHTLFLKI